MFLRLDGNPAKYSEAAWARIDWLLRGYLRLSPTEVFRDGWYTRYDMALDFSDLSISDAVIRSKGARKHSVVTGAGGGLETCYVGSQRKSHTIAYTKKPGRGCDAKQVLRLERRIRCRVQGSELWRCLIKCRTCIR